MDENELFAGKVEKQNMQVGIYLSELQRALAIRSEDNNLNYGPEQRQDLEDRFNLLSEENQVLFEQSEAYRIQFEAFTKSYEDRMREVSDKIARFDSVQDECDNAVAQLQEARGQIELMRKKMDELDAEVYEIYKCRMEVQILIQKQKKEK